MSNEELNRKISEAREPKPRPYYGVPDFVAKIKRSELDAWRCEWINRGTRNWEGQWQPIDWTGSEEASAVLRDDLINQRGYFEATQLIGDEFVAINRGNGYWMRSTALAWLKWKGITAEPAPALPR